MSTKKAVILSDSTCDLGSELIEKYNIKINPLHVILGEKDLRDGIDVFPDDLYAYYKETGSLPKTAACNIAEHDSFIKENVPENMGAVYFTISSELSTTHNAALLATEEMENVYVVDSRNLSTGIGLQVLYAADLAEQGLSAKEIYDKVMEIIDCVDASFVVDTLEYLHKGGRCSSVAALGANLLKLHPLIQVKNGKMSAGKKFRGKISDVYIDYAKEKLSDLTDIDTKRVFITHSGCKEEHLKIVEDFVRSQLPASEILVTRAGSTVSVHCGYGTLGVLFIRKSPLK